MILTLSFECNGIQTEKDEQFVLKVLKEAVGHACHVLDMETRKPYRHQILGFQKLVSYELKDNG